MPEAGFEHVILLVGRTLEAFGVAVIALGVVLATVRFVAHARDPDAYGHYRRGLGRGLLLGLELLVAGDVIRTVTTDPTLMNVVVLGIIVLIRTFLSMSIELEVEGRVPWRGRGDDEARGGARSRAPQPAPA